jgi:hypothetical protein
MTDIHYMTNLPHLVEQLKLLVERLEEEGHDPPVWLRDAIKHIEQDFLAKGIEEI